MKCDMSFFHVKDDVFRHARKLSIGQSMQKLKTLRASQAGLNQSSVVICKEANTIILVISFIAFRCSCLAGCVENETVLDKQRKKMASTKIKVGDGREVHAGRKRINPSNLRGKNDARQQLIINSRYSNKV